MTVDAGAYSVSEAGPSGYVASLSADCSGTLAASAQKNLHRDERRRRGEAGRDQARRERQRRHGRRGQLHDDRGRSGHEPAVLPRGGGSGQTSRSIRARLRLQSGPSGYAATLSADCAGTIAIGQTKTCTVTNNDVQPKLIVVKHVINDEGGTAVAGDFTMNVTGPSATPGSFPGTEAPGTQVALNAGAYSVSEAAKAGYVRAPRLTARHDRGRSDQDLHDHQQRRRRADGRGRQDGEPDVGARDGAPARRRTSSSRTRSTTAPRSR